MKKILIVEDDKLISMALALRLKSKGYDVKVASDAVLAVTMAVKQPPDLIVMDISMPGGNGFMVAERIQNLTPTIGVPIIFITASKKPGLKEKAMELGAVGFFEKPYEDAQLVGAIQEALSDPVNEQDKHV